MNKTTKVIIVDDDPAVSRFIHEYLKEKDIASMTFESPEEALNVIRSESDIKLVLLDVEMPEMSGLEVLKKIKQITPNLDVIMVTGQSDIELAEECLKVGAMDYIAKPIDLEYLETSVLVQLTLNDDS